MRFYLWEPKKDVEHKDTSDEVKDVAPDAVNETQGKPHAAAEPKDGHRRRSKRTTAGRLSKAFRSFFGLPKKKKRQHHHQERTVVIRELSRNPSRPEIIPEEVVGLLVSVHFVPLTDPLTRRSPRSRNTALHLRPRQSIVRILFPLALILCLRPRTARPRHLTAQSPPRPMPSLLGSRRPAAV